MSLPSLFIWKRGWNKRNLKTGQIFEIKRDAVKVLKAYDCRHFYDSIQKLFPSLFTWKRGWNKRNLKTGQIFVIKRDAVKVLKVWNQHPRWIQASTEAMVKTHLKPKEQTKLSCLSLWVVKKEHTSTFRPSAEGCPRWRIQGWIKSSVTNSLFRELDSPLLLRSPALIETGLYWLKIRSTLV